MYLTLQFNSQEKVATWQQDTDTADSLSSKSIRLLQNSIVKKMYQTEAQMNEHWKKVTDHRTNMTLFERERMVDIDCVQDTQDFDELNNAELTQSQTHYETLTSVQNTIKDKRKAFEDLGRRIDGHKTRTWHSAEKIKQLQREIIDSDTKLRQQNKKIDDQYQRFQWIKDNICPESSNDYVERLDMMLSICEEIGRWSKRVESLKGTICNWREERVLLKDMIIKEKKERMKFRNNIITHLETEIDVHRKRITERHDIMTEHLRLVIEHEGKWQHFQYLDTEPRMGKVPCVPEEEQKLKYFRQEIQQKVKEKADISRKIDNDREVIEQEIEEMQYLNEEITALNKEQHEFEIESQFKEIQWVTNKFKNPVSDDDSAKILDKIESSCENIEKWDKRYECLKRKIYIWREKNRIFKDSFIELEKNMMLRNQKASHIEECIMAERGLKSYQDEKEKYNEILNKYKSARENLETIINSSRHYCVAKLVDDSSETARKVLKRIKDLTEVVEKNQNELQMKMEHVIQETDGDPKWQDIKDLLQQWKELVEERREGVVELCQRDTDDMKDSLKTRKVRDHIIGGVDGAGGVGAAIGGGVVLAVLGVLTGGIAIGVAVVGGLTAGGSASMHAVCHAISSRRAAEILAATEEVIKAFRVRIIRKQIQISSGRITWKKQRKYTKEKSVKYKKLANGLEFL